MDLETVIGDQFWNGSRALDVAAFGRSQDGSGFLASALALARVGTWRVDPASGLARWDDMAGELFGHAWPMVPVALPILDGDRAAFDEALALALASGAAQTFEVRVLRADGELRCLRGNILRLDGRSEGTAGLAGTVYDITSVREGRRALAESDRQLRAIVDNLPGIAYRCAVEPPWAMAFISDAVESLTGYPADDFLSGAVTWDQITYEEDRPAVLSAITAAVSDGTAFHTRYRIVCRSGEVRWVQERGSAAYSDSGEPIFLDGFVGDIHEQMIAEEKLRTAEQRYRLISRAARELIWDFDLCNNRMSCNEAAGALGYSEGTIQTEGEWWTDRIHPDDRPRVVCELNNLLAGDTSQFSSEHRFQRADGSYAEVFTCGFVIRDSSGRAVRVAGAIQDLTPRKLADAALRESEALNRSIVEGSTDCVTLLDLEGHVLLMNGTGLRVMQLEDSSELIGCRWSQLWPACSRDQVEEAIATARSGGIGEFTGSWAVPGGGCHWWEVMISPVMSDDGGPTKLVVLSRNITDRKLAEEQLVRAATLDPLTQLPNRAQFHRRLNEAVGSASFDGGRIGLMLLDLDDFKQVNDTLGHDAGDALLKAFSERLGSFPGEGRWFARLGGDEFALVSPIDDEAELGALAAKLLAHMRRPFVYAGRVLDCHATIGSAIFPLHAKTPEELLKNADIALYAAKSSQRGQCVFFQPEHRAELQQRLSMISLARGAVRNDRVLPFYQPKVTLRDRKIFGFEAFLRWRHDQRGIQLPATIAAAFEDLDLAAAISDKIVDQVIGDMREWLDRGLPFGHVAVNAAAAEFRRDNFAEGLLERLHKAGVPARCLQLEVTETVFLGRGAEYVDRALKLLSGAEVSIALDDFGTGYASLRHLKQFPVDVIKIDQSFVRDMEADPEDAAIIEAVLNLGRSLKIDVVAEGVETERQKRLLAKLGCRFGQGFLFSEAVCAAAVPGLLDAGAVRTPRARLLRQLGAGRGNLAA